MFKNIQLKNLIIFYSNTVIKDIVLINNFLKKKVFFKKQIFKCLSVFQIQLENLTMIIIFKYLTT